MSDNTTLNPGTGGDVVRTVDRTTAKTQVVGLDFGGDTGAGNEQIVTTTNPLPIGKTGSYFVKSTLNSSTAQLAPGQSFVGTIEPIPTALDLSINIPTDQNLTGAVNFYQGGAANTFIGSKPFTVQANSGANIAVEANGNYCNVVVTNVGFATTTLLVIDSQYGDITALTQLGNTPIAINEIGGQAVPAGALPVMFSGTQPVADPVLAAAQTGDSPLAVFQAGDPAGDFAGLNILEEAALGTLSISTSVTNGPKVDVNGNMILSDAPVMQRVYLATGQAVIIDTQGYASLSVTSTASVVGSIGYTNDIAMGFSTVSAYNVGSNTFVNSISGAALYLAVNTCRYARIYASGAGGYVAYCLRNVPAPVFNGSQTVTLGTTVLPYTSPVYVSPVAIATTNGQTPNSYFTIATTPAATVLKASAGRVTMAVIGCGNTVAGYLHFYNATAVTLGTTPSMMTFPIPGAVGTTVLRLPEGGLYFSVGIAFAFTGGITGTDNTSFGSAPSLIFNYSYI